MPVTRKKTTTSSLKNTYTQSPRIFEDIQKTLREHQARSVTLEYDGDKRIEAISFVLAIGTQSFSFKLPARYKNVESIFERKRGRRLNDAEKDQAYKTAWANIRDWLAAQMALIETEMVDVGEIFLPYLLNNQGETYYEQFLYTPHNDLMAITAQVEEIN